MMNTKVKKGVFWGVIIAAMVFVVNALQYLFGGAGAMARGPHGPGMGQGGPGGREGMGGMNPRGDFGHGHFMNGHHHGGGFHWIGALLFIAIVIAVVFFLVKWLRKLGKASSMQQFIDTSLMSSHKPLINQSASLLDQWEKNLTSKKENQ
ncbi:hypothetical protein ACFPA1_27775 [Neobacillus sp. GCM10023253]|uniref:hypothetical protein n=1 Tax=Neobacillus sp. GCM10023253 TaxID=3252644 RepID=UPI00360DD47B